MTKATRHEQEAKFQLARPSTHAALASLASLDGYRLVDQGRREQTDTYLDTPAYDLVRHGFVVRVRDVGAAQFLGIKSLSAIPDELVQTRLDMEEPLLVGANPLDASQWPPALTAALPQHLPELTDLRPIAILRQTRHKRHVAPPAPDAYPLAEWSLDDVAVVRPDTSGIAPTVLAHFQELELELLDEDAGADFRALVNHVRKFDGLKTLTSSKLERALPALFAAAHGEPTGLHGEMPLAEACRLVLHEQLLQILLTEHGVRDGRDPEYVHAMRVAIRRARAALRLWGGSLRRRELNRQARRLRRLGRVLGAVRDLDVALENLRLFRKTLPKAQRKRLRSLRSALEADLRHARHHLLAHLNSTAHRRFIAGFALFCSQTGAGVRRVKARGSEITPTQVRHTIPSIILDSFEQVRAYEVAFAAGAHPPLETIHALRIQAKYLRYSLEFSLPLMGEPGAILIDQLKELQEHLGRLNDAHVEQERLAAWAGEFPDSDALNLRQAAVADAIEKLRAAVPDLLAAFVAPANRSHLGAALARI